LKIKEEEKKDLNLTYLIETIQKKVH